MPSDDARLKVYEVALSCLVVAAIGLLLERQLEILYVFPAPDSARWTGDESWLMREYMTMARTGVMRFPEAAGSTLARGNGFVSGSLWITSLLYGLPANLLFPAVDPIFVGRTVSAMLSIGILLVLYLLLRKLNVDRVPSLLAILVTVATRGYYLASHSARYEAITALALLFLLLAVVRYAHSLQSGSKLHWILLGVLSGLGLLISPHALLLSIPIVFVVWLSLHPKSGKVRTAAMLIAGFIGVVGLTYIAFLISGGSSALGTNYAQSQYRSSVISQIPLLHLDVAFQRALIRRRLFETLQDAPLLLWWTAGLAVSALLSLAITRRLPHPEHRVQRACIASLIAICVTWWVCEPNRMYYLSAIIPAIVCLLAVLSMLVARRLMKGSIGSWRSFVPLRIGITVAVTVTVTAIALRDIANASEWGRTITHNQQRTVVQMVQVAKKDHAMRGEFAKPVILADWLLQHWLLADTTVRTVTQHFLLFPTNENVAPRNVIAYEGVGYVLLMNSAPVLSRVDGSSTTSYRLDSITTLIAQSTGAFTDIGEPFFGPFSARKETISLSRVEKR